MTVLQIKNLSLKYGNHYIFRNLSFAIEKNDFLCIVGPNGSGKSTLLKCLLGEIKPNQGKIQFENHSQRRVIGYLPQNPHHSPSFPASVYEVVASGSLNQIGLFSRYPKQKIEKALDTLHIADIARQQFSTLSGGQRQRVLLARALVASSNLLILDEPSNNLDYNSKQEFYRTLEKLNKSTTILMVTHDLDHNNLIGNKILSLDPNLPFFGTTKEYVRRIHAH
ncbi:MAG: metal ABC transporter ATP-binding protein [Candidatus Saccharibacteria bacterium]|nr:metal ABC transporter ATP-binding protein [Candidatus Saccharibacteria bacterium]